MTFFGHFNTNISKTISSTSYSLTPGDDTHISVNFSSNSNVTITVPNDSTAMFGTNAIIYLKQTGAGRVYVSAASGVTLNFPSKQGLALGGQNSTAVLRKTAANTWLLTGGVFSLPFASDLANYYDADDYRTVWPPRIAGAGYDGTSYTFSSMTVPNYYSGFNNTPSSSIYDPTATSGGYSELSSGSGFTYFMACQIRLTGGDSWLAVSTTTVNIPIIMNSSGLCAARAGGDTRTVISTATINGVGITDGQVVIACMAQDNGVTKADRGLIYRLGTSVTGSSSTSNTATFDNVSLGGFGVYLNRQVGGFGIYRRALSDAEMLQLAQSIASKWGI